VLSDLPKVTLKSFDQYIASIKEEYTAWSKVQTALADAPILDELDEDETLLDEETAKRKKAIKRALETSQLSSRSSKQLELPSLDTIPTIFFEENFNLANPRTFDVVTGGQAFKEMTSAEASGRRASNADFATDQILQEKLSHWLDVVELHLNVEISLRSASFFSALSNLQELDSQSAEAVHKIGELKRMLSSVDDSIARKGLEVIRQGVRRQRLTDLDIAMERVKDILKAVEQAEDLGEAGEIQGALDLADEIEREWESSKQDSSSFIPSTPSVQLKSNPMAAIAEEEEDEHQQTALPPPTPMTALKPRNDHHPPVRIANIKCMSGVPMRISTLRAHIAHALEHELEAVLVHVLREGCERLEATTEEWRLQPGAHSAMYSELKDSISNRARAPLHGLVRCGKPALDDAVSVWKDALLKEVRRLLRSLVPNTAAQDDDDTPVENTPSSRSSLDTGRPALDSRWVLHVHYR
jgi:vacuolar protein sorting-associated protein 54